MCDFSLKGVKSRPAKVGDVLVSHDFSTGTTGFRDKNDQAWGNEATAVCLLPGTELSFRKPVQHSRLDPYQGTVNGKQRRIGGAPAGDLMTATFIQVDTERKNTHHDALEFPDGTIIWLTCLDDDQEAHVLKLPAPPRTQKERQAQKRAEFVG